jgi:lipoprotein NlpD
MYSIAFRHQLDFQELAVWNDVGPDFLIRPGDVLRLSPPAVSQVGEGSIRTRPLEPRQPPRPAVATPGPVAEPPLAPPARLTWSWPTAGPVIRGFADGGKGIDIAGALGQPVTAAAPGKVVYSGAALKGYGELIIIKHDETHLSAYGHNRRRLVGEGVTVAAGQPIAELGLGPEQKPLLHFEVRRRGKPVDPLAYLPAR